MRKIWSWIIIENKRILLIKRKFNKKSNPNCWAFPWWWNENNETMEETAIREIKEEVWLKFSELELFLENKTEKHHFFRYIWKWEWLIVLEESECDWYWWFTYDETKKLLISDNMLELVNKLNKKSYI